MTIKLRGKDDMGKPTNESDHGWLPEVEELHTGLAGRPAGVMANDPRFYGGAITAQGADKLVRFIDMCDTFHLRPTLLNI